MTQNSGATGSTPRITRTGIAVFVAGVASMGLEILAGRLLAPSFGSGIYVWGSIIGVFLAALSLGYWIGGIRAAVGASRSAMAALLLGAAMGVAVLIVLGEPFLDAMAGLPVPQRYAPVIPITVLFGPPTVLIGFISPYAAELDRAESTGTASGRVYALGTVGSIVGAFGTTFVLVPSVDVITSELVFGLMLVGAAVAVIPRSDRKNWAGAVLVLALLAGAFTAASVGFSGSESTVYETQTAYQDLRVADENGIRTLYLDGSPHGALDKDRPDRYVFEYSRNFHLPLLLRDDPDIDRVLFIGGGAFSGPTRFADEYNATVDAVEIDPEVVRVSKEYFGVEERDRLRIHTKDGRVYLDQTNRTYDLIVVDAYRSDQAPHHLTTVEFMRLARSHLTDDGVVMANVISARSGVGSAFYRAEYRTMSQVFPTVYSFPTRETNSLQNIAVIATKNTTRVTRSELERRERVRDIGIGLADPVSHYRSNVSVGDAPILRDDYAPVDRLLQSQAGKRYVVERSNDTAAP
ncbi:spermidine synthase [Halorientalis salina]|uniref:spermidine synthase n=1 Tax=Halorientalis salina TaxID=2932266 RepID=UPI002022A844|nr:fused MFS/spermidine synthase [Halorientalis salina]